MVRNWDLKVWHFVTPYPRGATSGQILLRNVRNIIALLLLIRISCYIGSIGFLFVLMSILPLVVSFVAFTFALDDWYSQRSKSFSKRYESWKND